MPNPRAAPNLGPMCGRFAITLPDEAMAQLFEASPANDLPTVPNFNVCPTTHVHVVTSGDGVRHLGAMRWGFCRIGTNPLPPGLC